MDGKGYGSAGASTTRRSTKGFIAKSGSPREDIDFNNYTLRQRGRLLYMGNPVAASGIKTHRTNTVGLGLKPNPRPDAAFLKLSPEAAAEWSDLVKREFALWAGRKSSCDASGISNFYELQQMLLASWLMTGDVFVLVQKAKRTWREPYSLRLRAVEGDRVATPSGAGALPAMALTNGRNPDNGNRIYDGVEIDSKGGIVAYWFRNTHPFEWTDETTVFKRVLANGRLTGLPNVIHVMNAERPDQYRGVSYLAPVIIPLLQLNRYTEAELTAAIVGSFITGFVTTEMDASDMPFNEATPAAEGDGLSYDPSDYEMGPGTMNVMNPGEDIKQIAPTHPSAGYDRFAETICTQIGAALEIPRELLLKQFTASYSASRGALLEAWKSFRTYRTWFVNDFCAPAYELWMDEAVSSGRVPAPGFFKDPTVREAWLQTQWIGPSTGQLDPVKEVEAEILACQHGFSTMEDSAMRLNGSDFGANVERLKTELELLKAAGLQPVGVSGTAPGTSPGSGEGRRDPEDDTEKEDDSDAEI